MATTDGQFGGSALTLPIIPSKRCSAVLYKDGAPCESIPAVFWVQALANIDEIHRCDVPGETLEGEGGRRTQEHTEALMAAFDAKTLWSDYGVIAGIMVCFIIYQTWHS
jgi:hypothetical protein